MSIQNLFSVLLCTDILFAGLLGILTVPFLVQGAGEKPVSASLPLIVTSARTGLPIPDAGLCLDGEVHCATTDSMGSCTIRDVSPGLYTVTAVAPGYDTLVRHNIHVKSGLNTPVELSLAKEVRIRSLDKMVVRETKLIRKEAEQVTSVTRLSNFELANTAGTGNDINRVLAVHPSTVSGLGADFDNNLYVRGGHLRENVYLIDGIEFDNTSHFNFVDQSGGKIGFVNGTLVRHLDFYTGGFPSRLPPRLSSVIDMTLRNGSFLERKYQLDLSMMGLGGMIEGPFPGKSGSYIAGVRLVNLEFLEPLLNIGGIPRYGDAQIKLAFSPAKRHIITLTGLTAFDHFD